jgi:putative ABC transport system permease protein
MDAFVQDLRFAFRRLWKAPGFALTVVLTLAVGIGATTAIFSLVEGILLRPLPFRDSDRLVVLGEHVGNNSGIGVTARDFVAYTDAARAFTSMGGYTGTSYEISGGAIPEEISAARLTAGVFRTLGVQPILGRVFSRQEEDSRTPLAVISYALWLNRYQRDPHVIGTPIELDRRAYSIIGVMPRDFEFPLQTGHLNRVQLWVPMSLTPDELSAKSAGFWGYQMVARLRDGVSLPAAAQDADRVAHEIMRNFPAGMSAIHIRGDVSLLREFATAETRPLLRTLFAAVSVVLLIACANVAILMLVRAIRRHREHAVRLALGARSSAILRESIFEGMLISLPGGLLGLMFAAIVIRTALHVLPESMPRIDSISIDSMVALFALAVALVTGALCSVAPAFTALRTNLSESLKEGGRAEGDTGGHSWLRSSLVVAEIAIALVLLTVSGAFLRSYHKMLAVDPGYRPDHVLVARYRLPLEQYRTYSSVDAFNQAVLERVLAKPGIVSAGLANTLPSTGFTGMSAYTIEGEPADGWKLKFAAFGTTYGDYFRSMGIPLLAGRTFTKNDRTDAPLVVIVNQSMAEHSWPGQTAVGKRMHVGNPKKGLPWATVVGVVGNTRIGSRDEPIGDQWYAPAQQPAILYGSDPSGTLTMPASGYIVLRSSLPPEQMIRTLHETVAKVDPLLALERIQPMTAMISNVEAPRRFNTDIIAAFALGALVLAITGIYAVASFSVSLRTQEIAIRMALGAQRAGITRLILASGAKLALLGCGLGLLGSVPVSRLIRSFLFGVSATDSFIYIGSVLVMMLIAVLASAVPAARAARANPIEALRSV